jgi:transposase
MLNLSGDVRVFMCIEPVDLRKGFEGLSYMTDNLFPEKLLTGAYFVFLNKPRTSMKVLYWDNDGFALWCKRLERGSFPKKCIAEQMDRRQFFMLLEGIVPQKITPRFSVKKRSQ